MVKGSKSLVLNPDDIRRFSRLIHPDPDKIRERMQLLEEMEPYLIMDNNCPGVLREPVEEWKFRSAWGGCIYLTYMADPQTFSFLTLDTREIQGNKYTYVKSGNDNVVESDMAYYGASLFAKDIFDSAYVDYSSMLAWGSENRNLWGNCFGLDMSKAISFGVSASAFSLNIFIRHFRDVADRIERYLEITKVCPNKVEELGEHITLSHFTLEEFIKKIGRTLS